MQINDILNQMGGLDSVARELGISRDQAANGAAALLPSLLGGFKKQAQAGPAGLDGLGALLGQLGGGGLLDEVLAPQPTNPSRGNDILGQIFGSKDVSRNVARHASAQSGLDTGVLKQMLPLLAMMVTGFMSRQQASGVSGRQAPSAGGLGNLLGGLLGGRSRAGATSGLGGLASMLDMDGDGNPLDDIMGMLGTTRR